MMVHIVTPSSRSVYKLWDRPMVNWRVCKETADVCVSAPQMMADHFTAAEVVDLETQMTISLVCLK